MDKLTDWFYGTTAPVRPGVYETRNRVAAPSGHDMVHGYSYFDGLYWGYTRSSVALAANSKHKSSQQSKEWRGILK